MGLAIAIVAKTVDGHDSRVLEPAGDLSLDEEPLAASGIVSVVIKELLQRHLAVELGVEGDEDRTQPPSGAGPQDAEPRPSAGGRANGVTRRAVVVVAVLG